MGTIFKRYEIEFYQDDFGYHSLCPQVSGACFIIFFSIHISDYLEIQLLTPEISHAGFIAVREMSGRNKISQGQGIVREFYRVSGKFCHLAKLMKTVMEFQTMSGKMTILDNMTL